MARKLTQGPSAQELRLRAEVDILKRELKKLKRAAAVPQASPAPAVDTAALEHSVAELTAARQRLSKLYFGQVEENRKRSQKLHGILETLASINSDLDLDAILPRVAETIRSSMRFEAVLIRLREPGTDRLRARAFAGVSEAWRRKLAEQDVRVCDFQG